jgi:hypothetical protein
LLTDCVPCYSADIRGKIEIYSQKIKYANLKEINNGNYSVVYEKGRITIEIGETKKKISIQSTNPLGEI